MRIISEDFFKNTKKKQDSLGPSYFLRIIAAIYVHFVAEAGMTKEIQGHILRISKTGRTD